MKPIKRANIDLFEHDPEEIIIGEAYRHNIGMLFIFFSAGLIIVLLTVLVGITEKNQGVITDTFPFEGAGVSSALGLFLLVMVVVILLGAVAAAYVYRKNYFVLTDQKLVMVRTFNPVHRKVSQLSIGDIQDVSVEQPTLMSRMFKYATLVVETAGEQSNLRMTLIADPFDVNKAIVQAHESNMQQYGN